MAWLHREKPGGKESLSAPSCGKSPLSVKRFFSRRFYTNFARHAILYLQSIVGCPESKLAGRENREAGARPARDRRRMAEPRFRHVTVDLHGKANRGAEAEPEDLPDDSHCRNSGQKPRRGRTKRGRGRRRPLRRSVFMPFSAPAVRRGFYLYGQEMRS